MLSDRIVIFLPWLALSFLGKGEELGNFWVEAPQWKDMAWIILFYSGNRILWYLCMIAGLAVCFFVKRRKLLESALGLQCMFALSIGWVVGIVYVYSAILNPKGSLFVERYFMVVAPHILLLTVWGLEGFLNLAVLCAVCLRERGLRSISRAVQMGAGVFVALLLAAGLAVCYRNSHIGILKPRQAFREAAERLIGGGVEDGSAALIGSNKACGLDGFIEYYFVKRGVAAPRHVIDGRVNRPQESRFYKNYLQWGEEGILQFERLYCLAIHMSYDDKLQQFLEEHYQKLPTEEGAGIEIWQRR